MIVIFEGIDGAGKSTLIKHLLAETDEFSLYTKEKPRSYGLEYRHVVMGEYLSFAKLAKHIKRNLFIDRFHLSEAVYATALEEKYSTEYIKEIDKELFKAGAILIYCAANKEKILARKKDDTTNHLLENIDTYLKLYANVVAQSKLSKHYIDTSKSLESCLYTLRRIIFKREDWNSYFMNIAFEIKSRSTCARRKVGAVLVKDKMIISTGYNGSVRGIENCMYLDKCIREEKNIVSGKNVDFTMASHAEMNVIAQAARMGINISHSEIYITNFPCSTCLKALYQAKVSKIYWRDEYNDNFSHKLAETIGMTNIRI
jgi:dCMP deaminase